MFFLRVAKYHNKKETKKIGIKIKELRDSKELSIEDVASMTGFTRNSIKGIEDGSNSDISHYIEVAKAMGFHLRDIFDIPMEIKPRYQLSPKRVESNKLTLRITKLITTSAFFNEPKFVKEVMKHLNEELGLKTNTTLVSNVLKRLSGTGMLKYVKVGRQYHYFKPKK